MRSSCIPNSAKIQSVITVGIFFAGYRSIWLK
jgi:hypothetical protein